MRRDHCSLQSHSSPFERNMRSLTKGSSCLNEPAGKPHSPSLFWSVASFNLIWVRKIPLHDKLEQQSRADVADVSRLYLLSMRSEVTLKLLWIRKDWAKYTVMYEALQWSRIENVHSIWSLPLKNGLVNTSSICALEAHSFILWMKFPASLNCTTENADRMCILIKFSCYMLLTCQLLPC